jgi:3'(2'), 5'-bisphosphate nucleotidase
MIGLAVDEEAVAGVVQQPVPGITYWGTVSEAWMQAGEDEPVRMSVSDVRDFSEATLAISRSHPVPLVDRVIRKTGISRVIKSGSVGVKCGLIASRKADLYIHSGMGTKEWDTCAPEAILRGAGGEFTDTAGGRLRYNQPDVRRHNGILAGNRELHLSSVALLRDIQKKVQ